MVVLVAVAAVLASETFLVRPILDARVLEIIAGRSVPASGVHNVYIGLEALKLALILAAAIISARWTAAATGSAAAGAG
jgi:hypothetical protein